MQQEKKTRKWNELWKRKKTRLYKRKRKLRYFIQLLIWVCFDHIQTKRIIRQQSICCCCCCYHNELFGCAFSLGVCVDFVCLF